MSSMTQTFVSFSEVTALPNSCVFACPTDTVYGLSCLAADSNAVLKLKEIKRKGKEMSVIVLIASLAQLDMFVDKENASRKIAEERLLAKLWPGPISIVFKDTRPEWQAISPDQTLAIRMPLSPGLIEFIERVGPIISTSANLHGEMPATTAEAVLSYFPTQLDFIVNTGECNNPPSTLIKILR